MFLMSTLIGNWEKFTVSSHTNLAVFMFLFMICAFEVVLLKMTTSSVFERGDYADFDDSSEYEEDIYYEDLQNNYEQWARRRMRYRQRQERQHAQQMLQQHH